MEAVLLTAKNSPLCVPHISFIQGYGLCSGYLHQDHETPPQSHPLELGCSSVRSVVQHSETVAWGHPEYWLPQPGVQILSQQLRQPYCDSVSGSGLQRSKANYQTLVHTGAHQCCPPLKCLLRCDKHVGLSGHRNQPAIRQSCVSCLPLEGLATG
ncbi:hypothetical protein P154DRAFT_35114 [Amniculicola lignicola CBS 123094]|uniref:Uncharacterized protein n=1 Tax=Amniculicola lignicola CBS 123094 TaxID=1392246 RepID=A0A6A5WSE9_9PLEO|nr:hypothetical protein P154DRAFT_35114 [Amniculicola lignicola CBS 123094]